MNLSIQKKILIVIGLGSEILSSSGGYGPYQMMLIWLGILRVLIALTPTDSILSKLFTILLSISFTLIFIEGISFVLINTLLPDPSTYYADYFTDDDYLIYRMTPLALGHDTAGCRNPIVRDEASIVSIGDSQTWGYNTSIMDSWPIILGDLLDTSTYNLSLPGYGPADYHSLIPEALSHQPEFILMMIYLGNDLVNAVNLVYSRPVYAQFRSPQIEPDNALNEVRFVTEQAESARATEIRVPEAAPILNWIATTATGKLLTDVTQTNEQVEVAEGHQKQSLMPECTILI